MNSGSRRQRCFDHRLKELVRTSGDPSVAIDLRILSLTNQFEITPTGRIHLTQFLSMTELDYSTARLEVQVHMNYRIIVEDHNTAMPHSAFRGQVPDEIYYGRGDHVERELAQARLAARKARLETNRGLHCAVCLQGEPGASISNQEAT